MKLVVVTVCALLLAACAASGDKRPVPNPFSEPGLADALQASLDEAADTSKAAGVSASLYISDSCFWQGVTGSTRSRRNRPIEADMLFGFGSITKTFVAAIVLQLAEEDKLALDDSVGQWLAEYPNIDPGISIRQLLNHGSGLYSFTDDRYWSDVQAQPDRVWRPEEVLAYVKPPPSIGFAMPKYSNTNYLLLGMIIEEVTGNSLEQELNRRIVERLNLERTFLARRDFDAERWASTMMLTNSLYSGAWAAGAIASTSKEIAKWSHVLYSGEYLRPESMESMFATEPRRGPGGGGGAVGLGVWKQRVGEYTVWGHDGLLFPFVSSTYYVPELGLSVAYSAIAPDWSQPDFLYQSLVRAYLGNQPRDISACFDS